MTWEWPDDSNRAREASEQRRAADQVRVERERNRVPRAAEKTHRNTSILSDIGRGKPVSEVAALNHISHGRVRQIVERARRRAAFIQGRQP